MHARPPDGPSHSILRARTAHLPDATGHHLRDGPCLPDRTRPGPPRTRYGPRRDAPGTGPACSSPGGSDPATPRTPRAQPGPVPAPARTRDVTTRTQPPTARPPAGAVQAQQHPRNRWVQGSPEGAPSTHHHTHAGRPSGPNPHAHPPRTRPDPETQPPPPRAAPLRRTGDTNENPPTEPASKPWFASL